MPRLDQQIMHGGERISERISPIAKLKEPEMAEERDSREFRLRQLLPWTDLFRAFRIALDPLKLLLAAAAIVVLTFGWWLLALIFNVDNQLGEWPPNSPRGGNPYLVVTERRGDVLSVEFWLGEIGRRPARALPPEALAPSEPRENGLAEREGSILPTQEAQPSLVAEIYSQPPVHLEPFHKFLAPVTGLLKYNPLDRHWWYYLIGLFMTLAVWGLIGGAITRIAAVEFARNEKPEAMEAIRFAFKKFLSYFSAPLMPFAGVALIALVMILGGLFLHIPWIGELLAGLLWFLALLGGFLMAMILIGLVGWPLMYATISTEGSDSFDALSRSYSYVFQRPWHYLFYSVVAMLYGVLVIFFIVLVTSFMVYLSKWAVGLTPGLRWRATGDPVSAAFYYAPTSYQWQQLLMKDHPLISEINLKALDKELEGIADPAERRKRIESFLSAKGISQEDITRVLQTSGREREQVLFEIGRQRVRQEMSSFQVVGAVLVGIWLHLLFLVMLGFAYSYFWSVSTIIYFLLRHRVDETEMEEVYLESPEDEAYPTAVPPPSPSTAAPGPKPTVGDFSRPPEPSRPVTTASPPEPMGEVPGSSPPADQGRSEANPENRSSEGDR